jgi:hypothetical protein
MQSKQRRYLIAEKWTFARLNENMKSLDHGRMTSLSDTLTVGFVLVLLFGSIALYLYTCIQQSEQKISLLESILLDLKMSAEFKSYTELPAEHESVYVKPVVVAAKDDTEPQHNAYVPFDDAAASTEEEEESSTAIEVEDLAPLSQPSPKKLESIVESSAMDIEEESVNNYDTMSLKELQSLALTRGITGAKSMKKGPLQEALRTSDRVRPGSDVVAGSNSFVESSAPVSDETA